MAEIPPRPWWLVALTFFLLVAAFAGLMFALRWCGGPGERPHIRRIPLPPLLGQSGLPDGPNVG